MRKPIDGPNQVAKLQAVKKLLRVSKAPVKAKIAAIKHPPKDSTEIMEGAQMSGMHSHLPSTGDDVGAQVQRHKLGENKKRKDDEDEDNQ